MPTESKAATKAQIIFTGTYCESLVWRFRIEKKDFDLDGFREGTGDKTVGDRWRFVTCAPRNPSSDFHLHVSWRVSKTFFYLTLEYIQGPKEPDANEREPFAEEFVGWLERFLLAKIYTAEVHGEFSYPLRVRQSKFPLPLKAAIGPKDTEAVIEGISFTLLPMPNGVRKIWLTQLEEVSIHAVADVSVDFRNFDPSCQIAAFAAVLDTVLEEAKG